MSGSAAGHVEAAPPVLPEPVTPRRGQDRWALLAFVLIAVLGFLIYTFVLGADVYIGIDDLLVYTSRSGGVLNSLLQPYTTHLVALPFSIEWVIVELFGLTGGVPFAAVAAGAWIAGASLVRVIARQSGVDSWIATIVAASVVICGAIYPYNQPHTLQVPLAVALGLGQVAVANGRRWDTPRMAATIALTVLALSTSAVAMSFVAATAALRWIATSRFFFFSSRSLAWAARSSGVIARFLPDVGTSMPWERKMLSTVTVGSAPLLSQ